MKRALLILILVLSFSVQVASAEIDLSSYSLSDLYMLKTQVTEEISARTKNDKEVYVPVGDYIVGADIPVGTYTVTFRGSMFAYVYIYTNKGDLIAMYNMNENESIGKIILEDGQQIQVLFGPVYFSTYKGLGF